MGAPAVFLGVALVSACVLTLQLALTRLFSATMYYHFAFLAISLALFGSGAGGVAVYVLEPRLKPEKTPQWLALFAVLLAAATVAALLTVLASPLSPRDGASATFWRLSRIYVAAALPFLFAGCAISLAVTRYARDISRLYLFDLGGAAAGCLLLIPVLDRLGAVNTVLAVAVAAAAAAAVFLAGTPGRARRGTLAVLLAALGLLGANTAARTIDVRHAKGLDEAGNVIFSRWNSFSRVTVWGSLQNDLVHILIDADAATLISRAGNDLERHHRLAGSIESLAYHLRPGARTLVIGAGGGNDVIMARLLGATDVTAVEINPIIAQDVMSSEPFRTYSGGLFQQPGVRLVVDEARSFIRRSRERYGVIQGTMVDTWAATAAGAFSLTENNLYTVEAFRDYLERLEPRGILSMTRWYLEPPDQLLRLASLARAALDEEGTAAPAAHVALVRGVPEPGTSRAPATFLLSKDPFTAAEAARLRGLAARHGFTVLYDPHDRRPSLFALILESEDPSAVWRSLDSDVSPTRDNDPFFFHTVRVRNALGALSPGGEWRKTNLGTFVLMALLLIASFLAAACILGPLLLVRRRLQGVAAAPKLAWLLFFAALGAGFIVIEVALVQKSILFLGHPVYSLTVVLFSLLLFSGAGSYLSGGFREETLRKTLLGLLAAVALLVVVYALALSPVFYGLVHLPLSLRIVATVSLIAPLGIVMGMPMPTAIRILARELPAIVPWGWGVNGAASVTGSIAALAIALVTGFDEALLAGASCYIVAAGLARRSRPRGAGV